MSCCGKKRTEWLQAMKSSSQHEISEPLDKHNAKEHKPKIFEYSGNNNLTLKGIYSGKIYHFRFPGDKFEVGYEDSFAMMAEKELRISEPSNRIL